MRKKRPEISYLTFLGLSLTVAISGYNGNIKLKAAHNTLPGQVIHLSHGAVATFSYGGSCFFINDSFCFGGTASHKDNQNGFASIIRDFFNDTFSGKVIFKPVIENEHGFLVIYCPNNGNDIFPIEVGLNNQRGNISFPGSSVFSLSPPSRAGPSIL